MLSQLPLVTVVSPCFNHSKYVIESLESIKNQTYPNIEHIIIDDFSTDGSAGIIQHWIDKNNYDCTFIIHKENKGIAKTLNESILLAKGEFWSPLATDDVMSVERTEIFVKELINKNIAMIVSDADFINADSKTCNVNGFGSQFAYNIRDRRDVYTHNFGKYCTLLKGNYFPSSVTVKMHVFGEVGYFNDSLSVEDWDMWLRISSKFNIGFIEESLVQYRWHSSNSISNKEKAWYDYLLTFLQQGSIPSEMGCGNYYKIEVRKLYKNECKDVWDKDKIELFKDKQIKKIIFWHLIIRKIKLLKIKMKLYIKNKTKNIIQVNENNPG